MTQNTPGGPQAQSFDEAASGGGVWWAGPGFIGRMRYVSAPPPVEVPEGVTVRYVLAGDLQQNGELEERPSLYQPDTTFAVRAGLILERRQM